MNKEYIGDGVYVQFNEYAQVVLTTEYGDNMPTNSIFLEPEVLHAFLQWLEKQKQVKE